MFFNVLYINDRTSSSPADRFVSVSDIIIVCDDVFGIPDKQFQEK